MAYSTQAKAIEIRYGKRFKEVLIDLHEQHVTQDLVAGALGIRRQTLWNWMGKEHVTWDEVRLGLLRRQTCASGVVHIPLPGEPVPHG